MTLSDLNLSKISKSLGLIVALVILYYFSYLFIDILLMVSLSILIALIFNPLVNKLETYGINRIFSILTVFIVSAFVIILGFSFLIPKIVNQFNTISKSLNQDTLVAFFTQIEEQINTIFPFIDTTNFTQQITDMLGDIFVNSINNISEILSGIFSIVSILVIVPFMTFFFLKDNKKIVNSIINIMPNKYFEMSYSVIQKIIHSLGNFVSGWILDAFIVGFLSAVGLTLLGIDNSISIGFIAGVGHLIPYFGPIIGGLPAIIISLLQFGDLSMLPAITIMFVIIYTFDNGFIQPNVFAKSTDMHPLMIILLILLGSKILGVFGMLLAIPVATVIKTAAKEIYLGFKYYKITKLP